MNFALQITQIRKCRLFFFTRSHFRELSVFWQIVYCDIVFH
jgi:hypothetical protein